MQGHSDDAPFSRPSPPWAGRTGLGAVLASWRSRLELALDHTEPAAEGSSSAVRVCIPGGPGPAWLHPEIARALAARGIAELYSHQAQAIDLARAGRDVVVATPTASGKSLCFHLPVLDRLLTEPSARALYLFPTKALSRDQESSLRGWMHEVGLRGGAITYDGDTPGDARRAARERAGVLLTNPDMLHAGILPHHASWARFFSGLRFVVIDELHTYRGVFGSHLANVMRRLVRIARFHGSNPVFILASATIGNPGEHAARVVGRPVELVDRSGAPRGARHVLVHNPPVVDAELGIRASYVKTSVALAADLVRARVPTLVFGQSRNNVEVMLKYLRDRLAPDRVDPESIQAYRSGYLPETRRRIEEGLRQGSVRAVIATNALELGIDIGSLQAVICAGYPGTIASLWQRFGRAGRRPSASDPDRGACLAVLVTSSDPLDQYVAREPSFVVGAPIEEARIDPDNVEILVQHIKCAAFELPFEQGEALGDLPASAVGDALEYLAQHQVVHAGAGQSGTTLYHWASDAYPANHVSLRSASWDNFVIIDVEHDRTIAEMDWRSTHTMLHVQAIYQHEGEQWQVERLDFENHKAFVRKVAPDYYTTALTHVRVDVLQEDDAAIVMIDPSAVALPVSAGEVSIIEKVVGYKKIKFHTHENCGYGDVRLPEMQMHTSACWVTFTEEAIARVVLLDGSSPARATLLDAVRGIANALHLVAAMGLMCDPRDLAHALMGGEAGEAPRADARANPTVVVYDRVPGGVGLAPRLFAERETLLRRARSLIAGCTCDGGCPACIGVGTERDRALIGDPKAVALALLAAVGLGEIH